MKLADAVTKQIAEVSIETERKMKQAELNARALSKSEEIAIQVAKCWTSAILRPEINPAAETPYVPFPSESEGVDLIRAWYSVQGNEVRIGQSFCVFVVTVKDRKIAGQSPQTQADRTAKRIFNQSERIDLDLSGDDQDEAYGKQKTTKNDSEQWDWIDHLHWWRSENVTGFFTLKMSREPSMAIVGWDIELNRHWFRLYERRK